MRSCKILYGDPSCRDPKRPVAKPICCSHSVPAKVQSRQSLSGSPSMRPATLSYIPILHKWRPSFLLEEVSGTALRRLSNHVHMKLRYSTKPRNCNRRWGCLFMAPIAVATDSFTSLPSSSPPQSENGPCSPDPSSGVSTPDSDSAPTPSLNFTQTSAIKLCS